MMSRTETAVVINDPTGTLPEGEIISGERLIQARSRGIEALPVDVQLLRSGALGGYAVRKYGRGWQFDPLRAGRGCPLVLFAAAKYPTIHWAVRLVPGEPGERLAGNLRVAADTGQFGAHAVGFSSEGNPPLNVASLGEPDAAGGWSWRGSSKLTTASGDQLVALMLYGAVSGARVAWWAVSQGSE